MNLGDFHSQISSNVRRGTSLDAFIPKFTRQAALWLERNRSMNYMKRLAELHIDPADTDTPRFVELNDTGIKSIQFFRWVIDGEYRYMTQRDPRDFPVLEPGIPAFYSPNGVSSLVLSATPDQELDAELWATRYSTWPIDPDATHWLIEHAEDVIEARTMMNVAKHIRDPEQLQFWKTQLDDGLIGLYAAEDEFAFENTDLRMEYYGEGVVQG